MIARQVRRRVTHDTRLSSSYWAWPTDRWPTCAALPNRGGPREPSFSEVCGLCGFGPAMSSIADGVPQETSPSDAARSHERRDRRVPRRRLDPRTIVSLTLLIADLVLLDMTVSSVHGPVRYVLGLILGCFIPGWSLVGLLKIGNAWLEFSLTVAVSLALLMVIAQLLITTNSWHLVLLEEVMCEICLPSLIWQSRGRRRSRRPER
jgi:hypothetical protein